MARRKKIYLIITLLLLMFFLTACVPPTDKTTEYKEKNNEFKEYISAKLTENETNEYNRVYRAFTIFNGEETISCRYEIIYGENEINVYNSFFKTIENMEVGEWKVYTYKDNYCYSKIYSDIQLTKLISENVEGISLEKFLELYEHKEYAKYNLDLSDSKVTKIVRESVHDGWGYTVDSIKYNIQFKPNKEFYFEVLGNEMTFNNCTISFSNEDMRFAVIRGKSDGKECTASIIIDNT